jgi:phage-related protein
MQKYIAYEGKIYTIEWYFNDQGNSPSKEYYLSLSASRQDRVLYLFKRMAEFGKILNPEHFRKEGDKIFEFKPTPDRFLCFFIVGSKIIVTNAFEKKQQKLPPREKHKALRYKEDYLVRILKGTYYE